MTPSAPPLRVEVIHVEAEVIHSCGEADCLPCEDAAALAALSFAAMAMGTSSDDPMHFSHAAIHPPYNCHECTSLGRYIF